MKRKCILALLAVMILFSQCKKQETEVATTSVFAQNSVPVIDKAIINNWIANNPVAKYLTFDWDKATQTIINGKKIVRVPTLNIDKRIIQTTSKNGVNDISGTPISNYYYQHPPDVFFVQDERSAKPDSLLAYMLNFIPTNVNVDFGTNNIWTGKLYDWNLNSPVLHVQELNKNAISNKYALEFTKANQSSVSQKVKVNGFWDWLGGILGDIGDFFNSIGYALGIPGTTMSIDNGDGTMTVYQRQWGFDFGGGGGGGSDGGDSSYPPSDIYPGYIPGYGGDSGQPVWDPYGGSTPTLVMESDPTLNLNIETNDEVVGGYDATSYPDYQQGTPWPTISNIISTTSFVKYDGSNCLTLAKRQISIAGYQISGYSEPGQTYNINTLNGGIDAVQATKAVGYMLGALQAKIPIVVGIDYMPGVPVDSNGNPANPDLKTDHFIVIVGSGSDSNGTYFNFFDSATNVVSNGTSPNNKLYYNPTTGVISGTTEVPFAAARAAGVPQYRDSNGKVIYTITHVRRSKKI